MKILVLADVESKYLWDYFEKEKLEGIDLILSCGDLKADYMSFLASFSKVPILYVRGNHDDGYADKEPEGCICIEDKIYVYNGIRIMGLGGSIRYKKGINQYTQNQMKKRAAMMFNVNHLFCLTQVRYSIFENQCLVIRNRLHQTVGN